MAKKMRMMGKKVRKQITSLSKKLTIRNKVMGKKVRKQITSLSKKLNIRKKGWDPKTEIFFDKPIPDWPVFAFVMTPAVLLLSLLAYNYTLSVWASILTGAVVYFCISVVIFGMSYELSSEELRVFIGPFKVRSYKLSNFEGARYGYPNIIHEHWTVRFSNHITLSKKKGILRHLVITPSDPKVFLDQLKVVGVKVNA